jgi:hypothetical protein
MEIPYLIFNSFEDAQNALNVINVIIKDNWDTPQQMLDGRYCFNKPEDNIINLLSQNFIIEEYTHFWFIIEEDFNKTLGL